MRQFLIASLVMLVAACTTTTGKNDADLGSGSNRKPSPSQSELKQTGGKPGGQATQPAQSAAGNAASSQSSSAAAGKQSSTPQAGVSGPVQSSGNAATQGATQQNGAQSSDQAAQPDVATAPMTTQQQAEAQMQQLESAQQATIPDQAKSGSQPDHATAMSQATESSAQESARTSPQTSSGDKTAAAARADNAKSSPGDADAATTQQQELARLEARKQQLIRDGDDPSMTGTVTEQQLIAANPMLAERSVFFDYDKYDIKDQYAHIIEAHANFLVEHPTIKIMVEGNCDDRGGPEYNLVLGQRRAESVQNAMTALGVAARQIESVSFGAERPVAPGHDEESWAKNRRGDIVYPMRER